MRTPKVGASRTDTAMTKRTGDFAGKDVPSRASERAAAGEPFVPGTVVDARGFASEYVGGTTVFDVEDGVLLAGFDEDLPHQPSRWRQLKPSKPKSRRSSTSIQMRLIATEVSVR